MAFWLPKKKYDFFGCETRLDRARSKNATIKAAFATEKVKKATKKVKKQPIKPFCNQKSQKSNQKSHFMRPKKYGGIYIYTVNPC